MVLACRKRHIQAGRIIPDHVEVRVSSPNPP
jgi:hypothetical protein